MAKHKVPVSGIVYSTDPNFKTGTDNNEDDSAPIEPGVQQLKVRLETKHRAGKAVTLVEGFKGNY